jgi:hypothetical protein
MRRMVLPAVLWLVAVLSLLAGIGLVALSRWGHPLAEAAQNADTGKLEAALAGFADSESRYDRVPATKQLLPEGYDASVGNQLALQYRLGQYDQLLEKAATSPSTAATHFWAGCTLFVLGRDEEKPEARVGWLSRAEQEFKNALELDPDDWNTKYNYELTRKLLDELRKQPKTPPKQLMQLLRPQPKAGGQPARRVG